MKQPSYAKQLAGFLAKYDPKVAALTRGALARMRKRLPGAVEMVYDNYNGPVVGWGPSERASEAIFSIVAFPRYIALCFLWGAKLPDPTKRLIGGGKRVRGIRLTDAAVLDEPDVRALIARALASAPRPIDPKGRRKAIVKSISAKQRPRRPSR